MQVHVLASGSTGNAIFLDFKHTKILVDAGISTRRIKNSLAEIDKMFKLLLEEIHHSTVSVQQIIQNQEIMIIQNKQIIDLLQNVRITPATYNEEE